MGSREISEPISMQLFLTIVNNYNRAKEHVDNNKKNECDEIGKNLIEYYHETLIVYPMVIMFWESYLHERLFSPFGVFNLKGHIISELKDKIDNWDLETKLPKWLIGETFDKSSQPFQDFKKLIKLRNAIVHFKWDKPPKTVIEDLASRKLTLPKNNIEFSWTMEISSLRTYKWAINTIVDMTHELEKLFPFNKSIFLDIYKKVD